MGLEILKEYKPDFVILANSIYRDEIKNTVKEMGLNPQFIYQDV